MKLLSALLLFAPIVSQEPTTPKVSLDQLSFLKGSWKGEGYMITGKDQKFPFEVKTTIGDKLRGKVLFVEQEGTQTTGESKGKAIADFLGTISVNADQSGFITNFTGTDGVTLSGDGRIEEGKLVYEQVNGPGLFTRTTIEVKDNTWKQKFELTDDGKRFFTFMEITMKKS
jgi:hypothetical protein